MVVTVAAQPRRWLKGDIVSQPTRPNIVFVLCDNTGWGDFSCYGGSTPTPRIDKLASEGVRFANYTVGSQCTSTRSAILTGRQSARSGTFKVPFPGEGASGLSPWEHTIAELLSDAAFRELVRINGVETPKIREGKMGQRSTVVCELDLKVRPFLDEMIVGKATDYIKRAARNDKPFFTCVGLSNLHPPAQVHPDFDQSDPARLGMYADSIAEMDYRLGQIMDCVDEAGIGNNTIIVFSSDNGPE